MRIDLLLKNLCLVKTRSLARRGCESGSVKVNGSEVKPSREIREGDIIEIRYPGRVLVLEITALPRGQAGKRDSSGYFRIVRETPVHDESGGWNA